MKFKFSIIATFLVLGLSAQKINWSEGRKLVWKDFQGDTNLGKSSAVVALASCGVGYSAQTTTNPKAPVKIDVSVYFDTQKSWKLKDSVTDYVLLHEQKHFDIAELFGRKLRKKIAESIKNSLDYQTKFPALYKQNLAEYKSFQKKYDEETQHGIDKEKQAFYNNLISEELQKLNKYRES